MEKSVLFTRRNGEDQESQEEPSDSGGALVSRMDAVAAEQGAAAVPACQFWFPRALSPQRRAGLLDLIDGLLFSLLSCFRTFVFS